MNTYYVVRNSSDPKIVGVRSGGSQATAIRENFSDRSNADALFDFVSKGPSFNSHLGTFPEKDLCLENIVLEKGAKLTDFMSFSPLFPGLKFLVNEKVIEIFSAHQLPPYKLYAASLLTMQGVNKDYKLFYCPPLKNEIVDFSKTKLSYRFVIKEEDLFSVEDDKALFKIKEEKVYKTVTLALNQHFDPSLDLFGTQVEYSMYISQRLRDALVEAKCSGINIVPPVQPNLIFS